MPSCQVILLIHSTEGFSDSLAGKESPCNSGDPSSFPGLGRSLGERKGHPLQYPSQENPIDREAKSRTRLGDISLSEGCDGVGGGKEVQEGGDIYIPMADSC